MNSLKTFYKISFYKMEGPIETKIFTREILKELLSYRFEFPTKTEIIDFGDEYSTRLEERTKIVDDIIDGYKVSPIDIREWKNTLINYRNFFNRNPNLEIILAGRGHRYVWPTRDMGIDPESDSLIYELYIISNGSMELLILNTPKSKELLDKYRFLYSHRIKLYKLVKLTSGYKVEYSFNSKTYDTIVPSSNEPGTIDIDYFYVTGLKTIDDVFLDKIIGSEIIYTVRLSQKNLTDLLERPLFYVEEYLNKHLEDFPRLLELTVNRPEFAEINLFYIKEYLNKHLEGFPQIFKLIVNRPDFYEINLIYIEEYYTKNLRELPEYLSLIENYPEFHELNYELANLYIKNTKYAPQADWQKIYYHLAEIIYAKEVQLDDDEFKKMFNYLLEAGNYLDAKRLRTNLFMTRLGFPMGTSFGFDINLDDETLFNLGRRIKELMDKCK